MATKQQVAHTPGPWKIGSHLNENKVGHNWEVPVWSDNGPEWGKMAATAIAPDREMAQANARLISVAPDMLEVCELLAAWDRSDGDTEILSNAASMARAAIRKAKGDQ